MRTNIKQRFCMMDMYMNDISELERLCF